MPAHIVFFTLALSFISGVVYASLGLSLLFCIVPAALAACALYATDTSWKIAVCAASLIIVGAFYYAQDDTRYLERVAAVPSFVQVAGVVSNDPTRKDTQSFYVKTEYGRVLVQTADKELYLYGDALALEGKAEPPPDDSYGTYLAKEHVVTILRDPSIELTASGSGNPLLSFLFSLKHGASAAFARHLSPEQAAFVAGITLGINADFSERFLENLSLSGTRHLTAISGQNFTVMIFIVFGVLTTLLSRRLALALTYTLMVLFVALIGFQVSAVRALIMAFIVQVAKESGRTYAPYNALALSALIFSLLNPKVIVFDLGFQLSFLAVFAIMYLVPIAGALTRLGGDKGVLDWKESLLTTACAQLMTAPILITQFHNFSLTAVVTNVLILGAIPAIMILGFFLALVSAVSSWLAYLTSLMLAPLIDYAFIVINAGAKFAYVYDPELGLMGMTAYYGAIVLLMYWYYEWRSQMPIQEDAKKEEEAPAGREPTGYRIIDDTP